MTAPVGHGPLGANTAALRLNELRPYASVSRLISGLLCGMVLLGTTGRVSAWAYAIVAGFCVFAAVNLWREKTGGSAPNHPAFYFSVVLLGVCVVRGTEHGEFLIPAMVHPLMMISLLHGPRLGWALCALASTGLVVQLVPPGVDTRHLLPAIGVLLVAPVTALVARPFAALRQRVALAARLEQELDPRRGVQSVGLQTVTQLREATAAQRVVLCHRGGEEPTVLVSDVDESGHVASPALAQRLLALLTPLPPCAMALEGHGGTVQTLAGQLPAVDREAVTASVRALAELLQAERLQLVPDSPGQERTSWLLVVHGRAAARAAGWARLAPGSAPSGAHWPLAPLAAFAVDLRRLLQQAAYVDILQAEIAAHERSRIGRDLHDSALQPYLGLKFAVEGLAMTCPADNPMHERLQDMARFCDAELTELRETVSSLRAGQTRGEDTLLPALRRQAGRYSRLFGIRTHLSLPDDLPTSRALSGALLHMVNEALNNVRRHTRASQVWIDLRTGPGQLHLVVRDDAARHSGQPAPPFEPRSLSERARELGGTLQVRRPGLDTEIHISVPI